MNLCGGLGFRFGNQGFGFRSELEFTDLGLDLRVEGASDDGLNPKPVYSDP